MEVDCFQDEDRCPAVAGPVSADPIFISTVFCPFFLGGLLSVAYRQTPGTHGLQDILLGVAPDAIVGLACELREFIELGIGVGVLLVQPEGAVGATAVAAAAIEDSLDILK